MNESSADESSRDGPVTWDDVAALQDELKRTARAMLAREGNAGTVHTTQLLNSALKKLNPKTRDWHEVSWENREAFFKDAFFAMRRVLISYSRRPGRKKEVKAGGFESEHIAPLAQAGVLNLDRLVDHAAERAELAEAMDRAFAELDRLYPGKHLAEIVQHLSFEHLTQTEIAAMLEISVRTVYERRELAYGLLRQELAEYFPGQHPGDESP